MMKMAFELANEMADVVQILSLIHIYYCIVTSDNPRSENPSLIIQDILAGMEDEKTPYTCLLYTSLLSL